MNWRQGQLPTTVWAKSELMFLGEEQECRDWGLEIMCRRATEDYEKMRGREIFVFSVFPFVILQVLSVLQT